MKGLSHYEIRPMLEKDCAEAFSLSKSVGWGITYEDWIEGLIHFPKTAFVITDQNETIAAAGIGMPFEMKARLANIIVHPLHRRRGLGTYLVSHLIEQLHQLGSRYIELAASHLGHPLYIKHLFKQSHKICSWEKCIIKEDESIRKMKGSIATIDDIHSLLNLDMRAFGGNRLKLIQHFISNRKTVFVDREGDKIIGFVICSPEVEGMRIGPWIHENTQGAEKLLEMALYYAVLETNFNKVIIHTPCTHCSANSLLIKHDFHPILESDQMYLCTGDSGKNQSQEKKTETDLYYGFWSLGEG